MTMNGTTNGNEERIEFCVWAKPGKEQTRMLTKVINELADRCKTDAFVPHLTLWRASAPITVDADRIIEVVEGAISSARATTKISDLLSCELRAIGADGGTLVALVEPNKALSELHDAITRAMGLRIKRLEVERYNPHIALLHEVGIEDAKAHLEFLVRAGWLGGAEYELLSSPDIELAEKLLVVQHTPGTAHNVVDVLRELKL